MARPPQEAIETFMSITGADEAAAVRELEEHGGDLNAAVDAHFNEGDRTITSQINSRPIHEEDMMDLDYPIGFGRRFPLLPVSGSLNAFSLLDPNFRRAFFEGGGVPSIIDRGPRISHPREAREIPIEFKDGNSDMSTSVPGPTIEDVTGHEPFYGPEIRGTVVLDDDEDADFQHSNSTYATNIRSTVPFPNHSVPRAPPLVDVDDYNNSDIEEQLIRAVMEASKREAEGLTDTQIDDFNDLARHRHVNRRPARDDDEIARAVSLSLETAEQERALREQDMILEDHLSDLSDLESAKRVTGRQGLVAGNAGTSRAQIDEESLQEESEEEGSLVRHHTRLVPARNAEPTEYTEAGYSPSSSPRPHDNDNGHQSNGDVFQSEEWGGMSSEEHDEAVMLEAAIFGRIPEGATYPFAFPPHRIPSGHTRAPRPPSPALTEQRLLREQQDDEYLASLQEDREKELKAMQEAEQRRLEEEAAREAAFEKQKHEEEENRWKQREEEALEIKLAAKEAALPEEPQPDNESAINLVVRMPDGSRRGRRFLKSDKLQSLFDFMDIGRAVKPGTYRLVRSFPRRPFDDEDRELSFSELGLTSRQEALFLEHI